MLRSIGRCFICFHTTDNDFFFFFWSKTIKQDYHVSTFSKCTAKIDFRFWAEKIISFQSSEAVLESVCKLYVDASSERTVNKLR